MFSLVPVILFVVVLVGLGLFSKNVYVKAPPDVAYVISGRKTRVLIGESGLCIPVLHRLDYLALQLITVDVKNDEDIPTPTLDKIQVYADAEVQIRVNSENEDMLRLAMKNFLNKEPAAIAAIVKGTLEASLREKIGNTKLEDLLGNRESLSADVAKNGSDELASMGLEIVAFNIQSIQDKGNVINQLGEESTSKIMKATSIAKSNSEKEISIQQSKDSEATQMQKNDSELRMAENNKNLQLQKAQYLQETNVAEEKARAAKEIEKANQSLLIQAAEQAAEIEKQKKQIELQQLATQVETERLNSEVKSQADADLYRSQKAFEAESYQRKQKADAEFYEQQKMAEAKKLEAESIESMGRADANALSAKLTAEAEGLSKKAEAMAKMDEAAKLQMILEVLPSIAAAVSKPLEKIGSITMYGNADTSQLTGTVLNTITQVMDGVSGATGIDLGNILANKVKDAEVVNPEVLSIEVEEPKASTKKAKTVKDVIDVLED